MAERRAIKSTIWQDEFFGMDLPHLGKLVWIGLFSTCADSQGRMLDNPALICSTLFPYGGATAPEIADCLDSFGDRTIRYEVDGRKYIQLRKWWENQPQQYAVPSNFPAPPGWKDRVRTCHKKIWVIYNWEGLADTPAGVQLMTKLECQGRVSSWTDYVERLNPVPVINPVPIPNSEDTTGGGENPDERPEIYALYEREIGSLSPNVIGKLDAAAEKYPHDWITQAVAEAVANNVRKWNYVAAILERWRTEGVKSGNSGKSAKPEKDWHKIVEEERQKGWIE